MSPVAPPVRLEAVAGRWSVGYPRLNVIGDPHPEAVDPQRLADLFLEEVPKGLSLGSVRRTISRINQPKVYPR